MFKKDRFSIRKIKGVVGSVFLGSLLMAPSVVDAATYHYVNKEIISQEVKDLIQTGKPDRNEVVYGLVYQKDQLPQTGTEASVLTAFGLLTVGSLLLIYKRKKIASVFLVGAMGLVVLPSAGAVDPVATLALASREGVVEMDGYRYVGYLSGDILKTLGLDTVLEETSAKPGEVTVVEVETPQSTTNQEQARTENQVVETEEAPKEEAPKTEESPKEEPKSEVKPTDDTLPKVEEGKEDSAEPAPVEEVGGEVESKPEEKVAVKPESQPSDKPAEESKVEQAGEPVAPRKDEQAPVEPENQPEAPEEEKAVEETPKQEESTPDTKAEETVEPKEETVNQSVEQPKVETPAVEKQTEPAEESKVEQAGEPVAPREDEQAPTAPVEPEKQPEAPEEEKAVEETPKPEDKIKGIGTKEPVDKSELNNQIDKASSVSPTDYSTASYNDLGPVLETAKGVYASEPVKQPEVNSETNKLKTAIDALNVDKTELNNTIADAKTKTKEHYSDASWANLQAVLAEAEKVTNNPAAKQSEVDHVYEKFKAAVAGLTTDKTELEKQLHLANEKTQADYSSETWSKLEEAKNAAQTVKDNDKATQVQIKDSIAKLKVAIVSLNVDKTKLQEQLIVAEQKQEMDYSPNTWSEFKNAELQAKEINNQTTPLPKQSEIDAATKALQDAINALAVDKTALQNAINTANSKRKEEYTTETLKALEDVLVAVTPVNTDEATTQSKVDDATRRLQEAINNLASLTAKPVLTFVGTDKKVLEREAVAKYSLENQNKTKIKSITATLKKGEEVINTVVLTDDKLTTETISAAFKNLEYYKEYTLSTTMVYDRGNGDVTETLANQPIQLDLKKVEIKNIKETSLISVDAEGNESDKSLLEEKPTDITSYYLKITTHDSKVTRLAVDKIEEVEEGGKTLFKVTATAPDLIQRDSANKLSKTYTHYIAKKKTHKDNVYYDFNELVNAINDNPNGTFKLGADLNATNVPTPYKEYVPKVFRGHLSSVEGEQYSIHNIARQLFSSIEGGSVKNINLANVDINMPWINDISPLARVVKNATVQDVKVTGSILGKDGVAGVVNKVDNAGILTNIAFIGKIEAIGSSSNHNLAGLAGEVHRGRINQTYVNATIIGNRARTGGLVGFLSHDLNPADVTSWSYIKNSVAKGTIDVPNGTENGGLISKDYPWGTLDKNISMVDVKKGDIFFGSNDMDNEFVSNWIYPSNSTVIGVSKGAKTHRTSSKIKEITLDEANEKIKAMGITADKFEIKPLIEEKLNNIKPKADTYKDTQDYKADRELAYRNIEKLQPFYNKEWIVNQGNKIPAESDLLTKEVLSVTGMKVNNFVTDLSDADHIMIHYSDKTKEIKAIKQKESQVSQVREYSIEGLDDIVYTPNIVEKNRDNLAMTITEKLSSFELQSPEVRQILDKRDASRDKNANSEARQNNYIRDLYLEESVTEVKNNISDIVKQLIENEDHQLNTDEDTERALIKKIEGNKAKLMLGLAFLNRYYGVKFGDFNIKQLMMFKPDFYGNNVSLIDRLIEIGSKENNLRGYRTQDSFREVLAKNTRSGNLIDFLKYNMELLTSDKDINDWFIHSTDGKVYVVEKQSREEGLKNAKYRAFDNLSKGYHQKMILPLLNLTNTEAFLISTYNTISFGTANKYGKPMSEMKKEIDLAANRHLNYLDFWYRLANDNVKNLLAKNIVTPVWEGYKVWGHDWPSWMDRYGNFDDGKGIYAPVRELYGPTNEYYGHNGARAGAYATYYDNKNDTRHKVVFVMSDMLTEYGSSAFTHETTHVNDRVVYYGGYGHREGTFVEAFAQGMLQSPAEHGHQGEYGALGLNMAFERSNDGNQWYNYNPNKLQSREAIDKYMKNYNEALMMLDYLEADAVLSKHITDNSVWFKKVDKQYRTKDEYNKNLVAPNQWDRVRDLTDEEKTKTLSTINDLVDNNFATKHGVGNGRYRPEDFGSAYVNVNMMAGIYGGNSSDGAPGALSFKHNAFRMWGYYGYENGFIGYVSNKYKSEANKEKQSTLSDKFIIDKVSGGTFQTLEEWKKTWYGEVLTKAQRGFIEINIDGENISTYSKLQELFKEAVTKDLTELNDNSIKDKYRNTVALKSKIYKQLLKNTDGFSGDLFTAPQA
ncbi:zinc metalloprotease [Streptococcus pneumoniae]|uniref:ZmpA/ZmpB/ZmpC family metallo-endopeptidase n=3 Tax=Streptococcus pneumoniae TaxID=1313 RepID=UPI0005DBEEDA|nr:ZmpA/ZmpB/ZmpC family metallo-endopeptidase [Streptococcus pneumoniae]CGF46338.1 zinc metalloprotease [Streptococcus pneumoniae]CIN82009.1 zinc metalloprotease [Streptococcus pneumoniae]CIO16732.1 zinc metalloprotease [Streptococcus pneumoniae]CIO68548.1 zinc metalloprotease [Streptococcus pneumoniae]CIO91220.1 zinc metalloprotease [Streptococcus pneumoniae]